jgi:hypothetical protein
MKKFIKNGVIKSRNNIVLRVNRIIKMDDGSEEVIVLRVICPNDSILAEHGWIPYTPPEEPNTKTKSQIVDELVINQYNSRTDISDAEGLEYMDIIYPWGFYLGRELVPGMLVIFDDKLWRVRQKHTPLDVYPPSINTASLYEVVEKGHSGEIDDPIPYSLPMEIFNGKYYTEDGVLYKCTRDSGTALSHNLSALVGLYVEKA